MAEDSLIRDLQALSDGSAESARKLFDRLSQELLPVIRRQMTRQLRVKYDSQDFLQMVWKSFFRKTPQTIANLRDTGKLSHYLKRMARFKVLQERRKQQALKHDVRREAPLADASAQPGAQATPSQFAIASEALSHLMRSENPRDQYIVRLRAAGESLDSIAAKLGVDERTIRRVIRRLEIKARRSQAPPDEA